MLVTPRGWASLYTPPPMGVFGKGGGGSCSLQMGGGLNKSLPGMWNLHDLICFP